MTDTQVAHSSMVSRLVKPGVDIVAAMTPDKAYLDHMAMGIAGEAGEIVDAIKRHTIYGKDIDLDNVVEELGDMEFYMEGLRQKLGLTRAYILQQNIIKLEKRYAAGKYSDVQAQTRADKVDRVHGTGCDCDMCVKANAAREATRRKFLENLRGMDESAVRHLLNMESVEELKELKELVHPVAHSSLRMLINGAIARQGG